MGLYIKVTQHDVFLEVIVTGTYDLGDAIDRIPHVLSACRLTGLSKVLIDFRRLTGIPAATEKIIFAFGIQDHYNKYLSTGGQELMVASVGSPVNMSTYEPGLKIAKDCQLPFDLFTNIDEARIWLGVRKET